jgi:hypothetical protein
VANFSFTIDTQEMANGLYSVAPHIDGTTGAVVSMQTAVIIAEKSAAENICANVNRGFFSLIRSQISQKIATCRSQVEARLLELRDEAQKLLAVKITMQRDFQVIAARYTKLFRSLDAALLSRLHELDIRLLDLIQKDIVRLEGRTRAAQAAVPMHQIDSVASNQKIAAASMRAKTSLVIGVMSQFIQESIQQDRLTESILSSGSGYVDVTVLLPVCLVEYDSLQAGRRQWQYHAPTPARPDIAQQINGAIERGVSSSLPSIEWRQQEGVDIDTIDRCFRQLMDQTKLNEKVRAQIGRMFAASKALAIFGVQP